MFIDFLRAQNTTIILALFCSQMMFSCVNFRILRALFFFFFFFRSYLLKSFVKAVEDIFARSMIVPRLGVL